MASKSRSLPRPAGALRSSLVSKAKSRSSSSSSSLKRQGPQLGHDLEPASHSMLITVSKEDYLKAIAEAEMEGEMVIAATLSHWLSVTRAAVTAALQRLRKDGLVNVKADGRVQLTAEGRRIAEKTILRHHLVERMLCEIFGMPWYAVHEEAERLEHAISPAFESKLVEKLGEKESCPHGNGLTLRSPEERRKRGLCLLSEAEAGLTYLVSSLYERDRKLLEFFENEGIRPGVHLAVQTRNYDGTISLALDNDRNDKKVVRIGSPAAEKVWVVKRVESNELKHNDKA